MTPKPKSSAQYRSHIGNTRRRLADYLEEVSELGSIDEFKDASDKDIYNEIASVADLAERIRLEIERINHSEASWKELFTEFPEEQKKFDEYKAEKGDFTIEVKKAKDNIDVLKVRYDALLKLHQAKSPDTTSYPAFGGQYTITKQTLPVQTVQKQDTPATVIQTQPIFIQVPEGDGVPHVVHPPAAYQAPQGQNYPQASIIPQNSIQPSNYFQSAPLNQSSAFAPPNATMIPPYAGPGYQSVPPTASQAPPAQQPYMPKPNTQPPPFNQQYQQYPSQPTMNQQFHWPQQYAVNGFASHVPVTLPSIKLPTFDGNPLEYRTFIEQFSSTVDTHPYITDCTRLSYLQSSLKGSAQMLLQHLSQTADNYRIARSILENQFGGNELVLHTLNCKLQDLPSVHQGSAQELQNFWNQASATFHQLRAYDPDCDNHSLATTIIRKLPKRYLDKLVTRAHTERIKLSELLDILGQLIKKDLLVIAMYSDNSTSAKKATTMSVQQAKHSGNKNSAHGSMKPVTTPCVFCESTDKFHRHDECPIYPTAADRKKIVKNKMLCFKCLRTGHGSRDCKVNRQCYYCKGPHHSALCSSKNQNKQPSRGANNFQPQQMFHYQPNQPIQNPSYQQQQNSGNSHVPRSQSPHRQQNGYRSSSPGKANGFRNQSPGRNYTGQDARSMNTDPRRVQFANTNLANASVVTGQVSDSIVENQSDSVTLTSSSLPITVVNEVQSEPIAIPSQPEQHHVAMMATKIDVEDSNGDLVTTTVFFDTGSDRSYISGPLVRQLKLEPLDEKRLSLLVFGTDLPKLLDSSTFLVNMHINNEKITIPLSKMEIMNPVTTTEVDEATLQMLIQDSEMVLPRSEERPGILIGLERMAAILGNTSSSVLPNGLTLHHTRCGNMVTGLETNLDKDAHAAEEKTQSCTTIALCQPIDKTPSVEIEELTPEEQWMEIRGLMERLWSLDVAGIFDNPRTTDDEATAQFFEATTKRLPDGRYECRWPFKENISILPDNRYLALLRMWSNLNKLKQNEVNYKKYNDIIEDQIARGFIEIVPDESVGSRVHYIAHHAVYKPTSTSTKMRIVYDASARAFKSAKSLNDMLHTGESMLPKINALVIRLREPEILVSCDIEKAFLMLSLHPDDRDLCRFLWQAPGSEEVVCYRFKRVPFGVKTSPYLLNSTIKKHLLSQNSTMANKMLRGTYVDNIFYGVNTVDEGLEFFNASKKIFADAQMNVTQFYSNCESLDKSIAEKEGTPSSELTFDHKLLGIYWNTQNDTFNVQIPSAITEPITKRNILKFLASIYDPLGLLGPLIVRCKLFMQKLWKLTVDWDEPVKTEEQNEWNIIQDSLTGDAIYISRNYFATPTTSAHKMELHVFGDASDQAYGAVAYLRRIGLDSIETSLVSSTSRVAPLRKTLTIPQAELAAIEKAANLACIILKELDAPITKLIIWSDSMCSIDQLASNKAANVFGRNRLRNINRLVPNCIFSHIPGTQNPADVLSRGCSLHELRDHDLWWTGPKFLKDVVLPIRKSSIEHVMTVMCLATEEKILPTLNLDPHRFSSFHRMYNVVTRILKLSENDETKIHLKAKLALIRLAQQLHSPDDRTINNLNLVREDDVWFYIGRVPERKVPFLPAHRIAKLFVIEIHLQYKHSSPMYTLAKVRNEVWIPKGLSFVTKAIRECLFCQRQNSKPTYQPQFPMLPQLRTSWNLPFSFTGMDYAGPFLAINRDVTHKYWLLLFTCLSTRYTHVELVSSLDAVSLLAAQRRFCAMFGCPIEIRTDNAAQIKMMAAVTKEAEQQMQTNNTVAQRLPRYKLIPALSPWSGGMYERVVGLLKANLVKAGATRKVLTEDDLRTLLQEAVAIINDRPLTYVSNDDISPLRPVDFVFPNKRSNYLLTVDETIDTLPLPSTHAVLLETWMQTSSLTEHFNRRWREEYVQLLQTKTQLEHKQHRNPNKNPLDVGSIVMIEDDAHKTTWPLARVDELGPRSAKLFVPRTGRTVERPFKKIYQLELEPVPQENSTGEEPATPVPNVTVPATTGPQTRSRTKAAAAAALVALSMVPSADAAPVDPPTVNTYEDTYQWMIQMFMILGSAIFFAALLQILVCVVQCSKNLVKYIRQAFMLVGLVLCCRTSKNKAGIIILLCLLFVPATIRSCNDIAHISASEKACYDHINMSQCHIQATSRVSVRANGSTSCLEIRPENDEPLATLKITAESIVSYCQKRTVFYSRDFKLTHEYVRRCDDAGSCKIALCGSITHDQDIKELSQAAKQKPGFTGCLPGCGGWHCSCWWYNPSCLFYRYYALPTSNDIYEVFQCPIWLSRLRVNVQLGELKLSTELTPGIKYQLPNANISITAIEVAIPPMHVHTATFVAAYGLGSNVPHWVSFTQTPPSAPGAPAKGFTGEMQCASRKNAEDFNCKFDQSLCKCTGFATEVNCQCSNQLMSDHKKTNKLPTKGVHHQTVLINNNVATLAVEETLVGLQIEIVNATISRMTTVQSCQTQQIGEITGCHSCFEGGKVPIICKSPKPTKALVHCKHFETSMSCGPDGPTNYLTLAMDFEDVTLNCSVDCGKRTYLAVTGKLETKDAFENNSTYYPSPFEKIISGTLSLSSLFIDFMSTIFSPFSTLISLIVIALLIFGFCIVFRKFLSRLIAKRKLFQPLHRHRYF